MYNFHPMDFFTLLVFFSCAEIFSFMKSDWLTIGHNSWVNWVLLRRSFDTPRSSISYGALPMFSSRSFSISGFQFRSLIHLGLLFVRSDRYESNFILLPCGHLVFDVPHPSPFIEGVFFSSAYIFGIFDKYYIAELVCMCVYVWVFPHWSTCFFSCQCHIFLIQ